MKQYKLQVHDALYGHSISEEIFLFSENHIALIILQPQSAQE
jgi:hypothetical protein